MASRGHPWVSRPATVIVPELTSRNPYERLLIFIISNGETHMTAKIINAYKTFPADIADDIRATLKDIAAGTCVALFAMGAPLLIASLMHAAQ